MQYKVNPVKATCMNLENGDGIQAINDKCFGICAAFSGTYDTYSMDPKCVESCKNLVEQKRIELYGVGSCDHQAPYRSVFWGQVPRYVANLVKKGMNSDSAYNKCMKMCENVPNLSLECQAKCKLDYDSLEEETSETSEPIDNKLKPTIKSIDNKPIDKFDLSKNQVIRSENNDENKKYKYMYILFFILFLCLLIIMCYNYIKRK